MLSSGSVFFFCFCLRSSISCFCLSHQLIRKSERGRTTTEHGRSLCVFTDATSSPHLFSLERPSLPFSAERYVTWPISHDQRPSMGDTPSPTSISHWCRNRRRNRDPLSFPVAKSSDVVDDDDDAPLIAQFFRIDVKSILFWTGEIAENRIVVCRLDRLWSDTKWTKPL